jgi:hypothetical protein
MQRPQLDGPVGAWFGMLFFIFGAASYLMPILCFLGLSYLFQLMAYPSPLVLVRHPPDLLHGAVDLYQPSIKLLDNSAGTPTPSPAAGWA